MTRRPAPSPNSPDFPTHSKLSAKRGPPDSTWKPFVSLSAPLAAASTVAIQCTLLLAILSPCMTQSAQETPSQQHSCTVTTESGLLRRSRAVQTLSDPSSQPAPALHLRGQSKSGPPKPSRRRNKPSVSPKDHWGSAAPPLAFCTLPTCHPFVVFVRLAVAVFIPLVSSTIFGNAVCISVVDAHPGKLPTL